jgi:hypothetical protein
LSSGKPSFEARIAWAALPEESVNVAVAAPLPWGDGSTASG